MRARTVGATAEEERRQGRNYLVAYSSDRASDSLLFTGLVWVGVGIGGLGVTGTTAVTLAWSVPQAIGVLWGSGLADRVGLARAAVGTLWLRLLLTAAIVVVAGADVLSTPALLAVAVSLGMVDAVHMPAMRAVSGVLWRGRATVRAQGTITAIGRVAEVAAGPIVGITAAVAAPLPAVISALFLVIALVAMSRLLRSHRGSESTLGGGRHSQERLKVWAGVRQVMGIGSVRVMVLLMGIANAATVAPVVAGIPLYAAQRGWQGWQFGLVAALVAAGGVVGGVAVGRWGDRVSRPGMVGGGLMVPCALGVALLMASTGLVTAVAAAVIGVTSAAGAGLMYGQMLATAPPELQGRVSGVAQFSAFGLAPLGFLAFGAISSAAGLAWGGLAMAVSLAAAGTWGLAARELRTHEF